MSRRCHHGSPRHGHALPRELRRGPGAADRLAAPGGSVPGGAVPGGAAPDPADRRPSTPEPTDAAARGDTPPDGWQRAAERARPVAVDEPPQAPGFDDPVIPQATGSAGLETAGAEPGRRHEIVDPPDRAAVRRERPAAEHRPPIVTGPSPSGRATPAFDPPPGGVDPEHAATAPQLRRFIKSRAYVPIHELRRRFGINGDDDEVNPVVLERERVFVGLPPRESQLLAELLRGGDIGYELSMDPIAPIVVGVYPMRPVPRS